MGGFAASWMVPLNSDNSSGMGNSYAPTPNFLTSSWDRIEGWFSGKNVDTTGMTPGMTRAAQASSSMRNMGLFVGIVGGINSAVGAYFGAQAQQYQLKSQSLSYQYQADIAKINARSSEYDAESILESSKSQIGQYTMQAGQAKAAAKTSMAGRGLVLGEGSTRDVEASMDVVKDITVLNMNSNAVRAAEAERTVGQNYRNQALLDTVSANNARRSADTISPFGSMFGSLLSSGSQVGLQWVAGMNRQLMEGVY